MGPSLSSEGRNATLIEILGSLFPFFDVHLQGRAENFAREANPSAGLPDFIRGLIDFTGQVP